MSGRPIPWTPRAYAVAGWALFGAGVTALWALSWLA